MKSLIVLKKILLEISKGHSNIKIADTLVFTWGNPSRGDDALGPHIYDILQKESLEDVEVLTDYQLQIEHVVDLEQRKKVLFIDASVLAKAPFEFYQIYAEQDDSYTTHAMSPQSLLAVYKKVNGREPPPSFVLTIRAYEFELGSSMSNNALNNLAAAILFLTQQLFTSAKQDWQMICSS